MPPFRFNATSVHLTYRDHLNFDELKAFLGGIKPIKYISLVHENGHGAAEEEGAVDYAHTHVFVQWESKINSVNARVFDFNHIHPHIQRISGRSHAVRIWYSYHRKEPVNLDQSEPPLPNMGTFEAIRDAPNIGAAAELVGIEPRSFSDLQIIRRDVPRPERYVHRFPNGHWLLQGPPEIRTLFLYGPTNTGKTQWALHQFENPLLVRHMDVLRRFDPAFHDGIVFDDMCFAHLPRESVIHLCDWEEDADIHVRYVVVHIPAGTRKIICANKSFEENFPEDPSGAIRRRVHIIHVVGPTYQVDPPAPAQEPVIALGDEEWHAGEEINE